jgi:hypothetical protein
MPRTTTTVVNDIERLLCLRPERLSVEWKIPVERDGWSCHVSVGLSADSSQESIYVAVHAHGSRTGDDHDNDGSAFYSAFFGKASCQRITRAWLETTLAREIETAALAARSFTEADLKNEPWRVDDPEQHYLGMSSYFDSTFAVEDGVARAGTTRQRGVGRRRKT